MRKCKDLRIEEDLYHSIGVTGTGPEQTIAFYIEIYEESSAYYMASRLQQENWEVNVMKSSGCWICIAQAVVNPDSRTIDDLCDYLADVSDFYGGSFQRWELGESYPGNERPFRGNTAIT